MEEIIDYPEIIELSKRLGIKIITRGPATRYIIRFSMKRRWGGDKKYAYECTLGTLNAYVAQIEHSGGKIIGID